MSTDDKVKILQTAELLLQDIERWRPESADCPDCGLSRWDDEDHKPECLVTQLGAVLRKVEEALTGDEIGYEYIVVYHTDDEYRGGDLWESGIFESYEFDASDDAEAREQALDHLVKGHKMGNGNIPDAHVCRSIRGGDISDELYERVEAARKAQREIERERQARLDEMKAHAEARQRQEKAEYERLKAKYSI